MGLKEFGLNESDFPPMDIQLFKRIMGGKQSLS